MQNRCATYVRNMPVTWLVSKGSVGRYLGIFRHLYASLISIADAGF